MIDDKNLTELGKETIRQIAKPVQEFISALIGEPTKELGGWVADGIRGKRFETQIKIYTKAQQLTSDAGLSPHSINLKILIPLLENGSLESNEDVADMWAHLLANASISDSIRSSYVTILGELEPIEAKILQYIFIEFNKRHGFNFEPTNEYAGSIEGALIQRVFQLDNAEFERSIDNLFRVRLLAPTASRLEFLDDKETPFAHYTKKQLGVTYLGYYFAKACNSLHVDKDKEE